MNKAIFPAFNFLSLDYAFEVWNGYFASSYIGAYVWNCTEMSSIIRLGSHWPYYGAGDALSENAAKMRDLIDVNGTAAKNACKRTKTGSKLVLWPKHSTPV